MADITTYVVDDEAQIRSSISQLLELSDLKAKEFESSEAVLSQLSRDSACVIVSDIRMPGIGGMELLKRVNAMDPTLPIIMITGHGDVNMAVDAMKMGAYDFIEKPFDPEALIAKVERAVQARSLTLDNRLLRFALSNPERLKHVFVGSSNSVENLRAQILELAQSDDHVLIKGEAGTGRSLAARSLHAASPRSKNPLRVINAAAFDDAKLEKILFDDPEEGAPFTSPAPLTLVIDEINAMSERLQKRLAAKLDEYGDEPHIRVLAIETDGEPGELVDPLKYQLEGKTIQIAPLRERGADILSIFNKYYEHFAQDYGNDQVELGANHAAILMTAPWPGNVRQLIKLVERLAMYEGEVNLQEFLESEIGENAKSSIQSSSPLKAQVDAFEEMLIRNSLMRHNGSISAVLEELSLPRRTLNEKMARYGLSRGDFVS